MVNKLTKIQQTTMFKFIDVTSKGTLAFKNIYQTVYLAI